ncbi:MAG: NAD(P)H-dependent oxidoreductase [Defluviitaleaceae bacterium]|nr:NAD(P)H-dependent oxidoreductase [Defluviitaleaceae bacterium]
MKATIFYGSPRKGNTYLVVKKFMDELLIYGNIEFSEFFLPNIMPKFCIGCQLCLGSSYENCPHSEYTKPILTEILSSDMLIFATPHYGASMMPACMKNLIDHLDFLNLVVAPRKEMFDKRAFILTTGTGSKAAIKPIKKWLKHLGVNRVYSLGFRMFTNKWCSMSKSKQLRFEKKLTKSAKKFYKLKKKRPYISTIFMYYMSKAILKKYVKEGNYPYDYWTEQGYFDKRPF